MKRARLLAVALLTLALASCETVENARYAKFINDSISDEAMLKAMVEQGGYPKEGRHSCRPFRKNSDDRSVVVPCQRP